VFPVALVVLAATVTFVLKRRERRRWANRVISGGRKALVLNLVDRR
jgi:cytochrome c-type biogenesis protein CcmH/NrfF